MEHNIVLHKHSAALNSGVNSASLNSDKLKSVTFHMK